MKKQVLVVLGLCLVALFSCDVHQWPYIPSESQLCIQLKYSTPMNNIQEGETKHQLSSGQIRYLVRVYPQNSVGKDSYLAEYLSLNQFPFHISDIFPAVLPFLNILHKFPFHSI